MNAIWHFYQVTNIKHHKQPISIKLQNLENKMHKVQFTVNSSPRLT